MNQRWDIFCKIVDNFGDIGVCWRLAKQLRTEHGLQVKLWIDDFEAAKKIITHLDLNKKQQICNEIIITKWDEHADFSEAAEIVIEAFSCELPTDYLAAMVRQQAKWINLEYLSAEAWVDDFHAKPSPQANGIVRHFYFPGFTEKTGGLIREEWFNASNIEQFQEYQKPSFPRRRESLLTLTQKWIPACAGMTEHKALKHTLKISLFCYPNAPVHDLLTALQASKNKVIVYVPVSGILLKIADFFGENKLDAGDWLTQNNLTVQILPFLSQADYDKLLSECDFNFVRGEDSWVRAIWAAKPFIWQPYFQVENTHIKKLDAFLDLFYADIKVQAMTHPSFPRRRESSSATKKMDSRFRENDGVEVKKLFNSISNLHHAWVAGAITSEIWQNYLASLSAINRYTRQQAVQLAQQPDLASQLVIFCNKN